MKPLYSECDFKSAKSSDKLPIECYNCKKKYLVSKRTICSALNPNRPHKAKFCSRKCEDLYKNRGKLSVKCRNCGNKIMRDKSEIKRTKNSFCSNSCSATYNNRNKSKGNRVSKLENWLEQNLNDLYPDIVIDFNKKDTIGSELDIYLPAIKIAFEINGIFHYKPIYGDDKFAKIKENDNLKLMKCNEMNIELFSIDTSMQGNFKPKTSYKYLNMIIDIIDKKINN